MLCQKHIIIALCFTFLIIGCSKRESVVTFSVGGAPYEIEFWEKLVGEFETDTGIKINLIRQPTDTDQRRQGLVIPLKSKLDNPDIFLMDVAWISQFAESGWLEPLNKFIDEDNYPLDIFFPKLLKLVDTHNEKLIALPVYIDGGLLYYRKDLLQQYGFHKPPQTWDELVEYSLKIQIEIRKSNPNFYGFVWQGAQYEGLICNFIEFASSNNSGIDFKNENISVASQGNIESVKLMHDLIQTHKISPPNTFTEMKEEEARIFFQQGNALFERNWPYAWSLHQSDDSKVKGKIAITLLPHFKSGKSVSTLGGWHIGISKYSDVKDIAWKFLKFILSYETQKQLAFELGWNPGRKDTYSDEEILEKMPHLIILEKIFKQVTTRPTLPYYTQLSDILQKYINAALSGKLTPGQALSQAEKESQRIMNRYNKK